MIVKQKDHQLILTDRAGCVWLFSSLFLFVGGTILYGALGGFTNWHEVPKWQLLLAGIMGTIGFGTGIGIIHSTPFTNITLNSKSGTMLIRKRGAFKNEERLIRFAEIAEFYLVEENDSDGDPIYRVDLRLKTGEDIRLTSIMEPVVEDNEELALRLNTFIC